MELKKRDRSTKKQLNMLVSFIEENTSMVYPSNNAAQYEIFKTKWETLTELLNNSEGPQKSCKQWKMVFADLKSNAKKKLRRIKTDQLGTGGGPSTAPKISELEERIIQLINPVVIEGLPVEESGITFEENITEDVDANVLNVTENSPLPAPETSLRQVRTPGPARNLRRRRVKTQALYDPSLNQLVKSNYAIARALNNIARALNRKKN